MSLLPQGLWNCFFDLVQHLLVRAVLDCAIDGVFAVDPTQQRHDVDQAIELSLGISLNDRLEFSKQRFDDIAADEKWSLSDAESAVNGEVFFEPRQKACSDQ